MTTTHDTETIGLAPSNDVKSYLLRKWREYVLRGITGKSLENIATTDGNVDLSEYSPKQLAAWQHCVRENGYIGSLEEHKDHLKCVGL